MNDAYDPLSYENLTKSIVTALLESSTRPLPPEEFEGGGVYAIYYQGNLDYYRPVSGQNGLTPIYVGKAIPAGARKGKSVETAANRKSLHRRLSEHAKSISQADNLCLKEFSCRYLVVVPVWIPLAERFLIEHFRPLWNVVLDGFGNHPPGKGRKDMRRPRWDIVHPGRPWAQALKASETPEEIIQVIREAQA